MVEFDIILLFKIKQPLFSWQYIYSGLKRKEKIYRIFGKLRTEQIVHSIRAGCQLGRICWPKIETDNLFTTTAFRACNCKLLIWHDRQ